MHRLGYDIRKFNSINASLARRMTLLRHHGIDLVFDVGANEGQFASELRDYGYRGRIVSFEPLAEVYATLSDRAHADPNWETVHEALGREPAEASMHVARNSQCSSILDIRPDQTERAPNFAQIGTETITVSTLDAVFDTYYRTGETAYLKLDVQGYEKHVIDGAAATLNRLQGVQMELSLLPVYEGETLFEDMLAFMIDRGFTLQSIEPTNSEARSGRLIQVDALFFRERA
jgi:FkbM family methyltransferase